MATMTMARQKLRADDIFFPGMALLILGVVVGGFAESYFLAGMIRAKLPNALVHIHGALFITWIFLLLAQTSLVVARGIKWHITLGTLGVILPPLMVVFGVLTMFDSIRRTGTGVPPEILLVGDSEQLGLFAVLTCWGMLARRKADSHKRLMILATMAMLGPAIDRWTILRPYGLSATIGVYLVLPLFVVAYDLWSRRRVHRSTAIACLMMVGAILSLGPLASSTLCQQCLGWIRR